MKILRREHRRRVGHDLDYALGLLRDIHKVVYKAYKTSDLCLALDVAMINIRDAKRELRKTKFKKEEKK